MSVFAKKNSKKSDFLPEIVNLTFFGRIPSGPGGTFIVTPVRWGHFPNIPWRFCPIFQISGRELVGKWSQTLVPEKFPKWLFEKCSGPGLNSRPRPCLNKKVEQRSTRLSPLEGRFSLSTKTTAKKRDEIFQIGFFGEIPERWVCITPKPIVGFGHTLVKAPHPARFEKLSTSRPG